MKVIEDEDVENERTYLESKQ